MNCLRCRTELIWGNDHDISDESGEFAILSILSCPNCNALVEVYYPKESGCEKL